MGHERSPEEREGHLRRIVDEAGVPNLVEILGDRLSGADFTSLMLEVVRRRAERLSPSQVIAQYASDRFVGPGAIPAQLLRRAEDYLIAALPETFTQVVLSPLVPTGTHSTIAAVDQKRVVSTVRATDVAADPTNALALEATARRRMLLLEDVRSTTNVRLAATQRVVRAQRFEEPSAWAHFQLFGLVTAGRDGGNLVFERESLLEHVSFAIAALKAAGASSLFVELSDLTSGAFAALRDELAEVFANHKDVEIVDNPGREAGRGYYENLCFKVHAGFGSEAIEIADGGFVNWTQQLVPSRKERLLISGFGVDRIALSLK